MVGLWLLGLGMALASVASAESAIFRVGDAALLIHLTDSPAPGERLLERLSTPPTAAPAPGGRLLAQPHATHATTLVPAALDSIVQAAARAYRLDPTLLHAIIGVESGYATHAVSNRGAQGLMQLLPPTARRYGVTNAFDPQQNVRAGARHLRDLLDQFNNDTTLALAAYNAGAGAVLKHGLRVPPYAETVAYVPKVLTRWAALRTQRPARSRSHAPGRRPHQD